MTPQQHDQAVTALATMICDWLSTRHSAAATHESEDLRPQPATDEQ